MIPAYQARLKAGLVLPPEKLSDRKLPPSGCLVRCFIFFGAIVVIVLAGFFPNLRVLPGGTKAVGMALVIEAVMLAAGAFMMLFCKPDVKKSRQEPCNGSLRCFYHLRFRCGMDVRLFYCCQ